MTTGLPVPWSWATAVAAAARHARTPPRPRAWAAAWPPRTPRRAPPCLAAATRAQTARPRHQPPRRRRRRYCSSVRGCVGRRHRLPRCRPWPHTPPGRRRLAARWAQAAACGQPAPLPRWSRRAVPSQQPGLGRAQHGRRRWHERRATQQRRRRRRQTCSPCGLAHGRPLPQPLPRAWLRVLRRCLGLRRRRRARGSCRRPELLLEMARCGRRRRRLPLPRTTPRRSPPR